MLAPSGTGKTTLLANLLEKLCPAKKHTKYKVWLFVATVHSDPIWQNIIKLLHEKRGYEVFFDTSLEHLQEVIDGINNTPKHERMFKSTLLSPEITPARIIPRQYLSWPRVVGTVAVVLSRYITPRT